MFHKLVSLALVCGSVSFATPTTITDPKLVYSPYKSQKVCYKGIGNYEIRECGERCEYNFESFEVHNEERFMLKELKEVDLFDEYKIAKELTQKLDKKDEETNKQMKAIADDFVAKMKAKYGEVESKYAKLTEIANKMGCVEKDKAKGLEFDGYKGIHVDKLESVTFPYSLKEIYTEMQKVAK